jgi:enamine deaminase RidA (YjgF/YER057c/UK114 family)
LIRGTSGSASYSLFETATGWSELHLVVKPDLADFRACLDRIGRDYGAVLAEFGLSDSSLFWSRFHVGDAAAELAASRIFKTLSRRATSVVEQAPLHGGAAALYAWHLVRAGTAGPEFAPAAGNETLVKGENYDLLFSASLTGAGGDPADQTTALFGGFDGSLSRRGMRFGENFLRSWIYVRDIDRNYGGMVEARKAFFAGHGVDGKERYPASTGIGRSASGRDLVKADFLSIGRLGPEQAVPMECPDLMPRPSSYGVTFERGLAVRFGDREHLHVSGTASIDRSGRIVHEGDLEAQVRRTIGNVKGLLESREAGLGDLAQMNVYLRDPAGKEKVVEILDVEFPFRTPYILLVGPVCRPGWLVEIDGIAVVPARNDFPVFR